MQNLAGHLRGVEIQLLLFRSHLVDCVRQGSRVVAGEWGSEGYFDRYQAAWPDNFDEVIENLDAACDAVTEARGLLEEDVSKRD